MPYITDENEPSTGAWKYWIVFIGVLLALLLAAYSCLYAPPVDPPTHMKSSDPYWYSGE